MKSVLGMVSDNKAKMKSVKIKVKFENNKMPAVRKKASKFNLADKNGVTR